MSWKLIRIVLHANEYPQGFGKEWNQNATSPSLTLSQTNPGFLRVCSASLLKTLREKEKLLLTSNFSFSLSVFYPF